MQYRTYEYMLSLKINVDLYLYAKYNLYYLQCVYKNMHLVNVY